MIKILCSILILFLCTACQDFVRDIKNNERGVIVRDLPKRLYGGISPKLVHSEHIILFPWEKLITVDVSEKNAVFYFDEYGLSNNIEEIQNPLGIVVLTTKINDDYDDIINLISTFGEDYEDSLNDFLGIALQHSIVTLELQQNISVGNKVQAIQQSLIDSLQPTLRKFGIIIKELVINPYQNSALQKEDKRQLREIKGKLQDIEEKISTLQTEQEDRVKLETLSSERKLEEAKNKARDIKIEADIKYKAMLEKAETIRSAGKLQNQALQELVSVIQNK